MSYEHSLNWWQGEMEKFVASCMNERAADPASEDAFIFAASGLTQEAAEVLGSITKDQFGKPQNELEIVEEMADVLFYLIRLCDLYGVSLRELGDILRRKLYGGHGWKK